MTLQYKLSHLDFLILIQTHQHATMNATLNSTADSELLSSTLVSYWNGENTSSNFSYSVSSNFQFA
jgi:hypothetical protein